MIASSPNPDRPGPEPDNMAPFQPLECILHVATLGMDIVQVFVVTTVVVGFELVTCNMDLKCKAREGCHFSGCDPAPLSLSNLDRNEFPITCQEKTRAANAADALLTMLVEQDRRKSKQIKTLTSQVANLAKENKEMIKAQAYHLSRLVELEQKLETILGRSQAITTEIPTTRASRTKPTTTTAISQSTCRGVNLGSAKSRNETGGVFDIEIPGVGTKEVYCNTEIDGGGWIVFQRRMDGSVDFYRNWSEYVAGFGNPTGEYWLGLEAIYHLTNNGRVELRIDLIDLNGNFYYAKYSNFHIGYSSENYKLTVGRYSGNATDSLSRHNKRQFTTKDRDNDPFSLQCAHYHNGAWWYNACARSSLNGVYGRSDHKGIYWVGRTNMRFTEMKLRKKM